MGTAKIKSCSVSFPPHLWAEIDAISEGQYYGNRSAYFRELFERDLKKRATRKTYRMARTAVVCAALTSPTPIP
jgi:metal-responsive CopG/Arc/MetJ family transcriptional regulator